jgi:phosphoglycolate phosphatase-like HAD superfamily hydrolase
MAFKLQAPTFTQRQLVRLKFLALGLFLSLGLGSCATGGQAVAEPDPLPSWQPGPARSAIIEFVEAVADPTSPDFVPPAERIAVFDNDGTLWSEQPVYFQVLFAVDRIRELAPQNPQWREQEPFSSLLNGNMGELLAQGEGALVPLVMASHADMSATQFRATARRWLDEARHPRFDRPYDSLTYQPMLEVLDYLRAKGFETWIVSGGGIEFLRTFAEDAYGIPPQQVVGSSLSTRFEMTPTGPVIFREPQLDFIDDGPGKPVAINHHIGRRPIAAFGNSDGDLQMLQWTDAAPHRSLQVLIRHTDAAREYAYDRDSHIGRLDRALDEASDQGWTVVDMARDWSVVFPDNP